jgi:hypothetical protein
VHSKISCPLNKGLLGFQIRSVPSGESKSLLNLPEIEFNSSGS